MDNPTEATAGQPPHHLEFADPRELPTEKVPVSPARAKPATQEDLETSAHGARKLRRKTRKCSLCGNMVETLEQAAASGTATCEVCGFRLMWAAPNASSDPPPNDPASVADEPQEVDELDRWLSADPVRAEPPSDWLRFGRWTSRHPLLTAIVSLLVAFAVISTIRYGHALAQLSRTDRQLQEALNGSREAEAVAVENTRLATALEREAATDRAARQIAERRLREAEESRKLAEQRLAQVRLQQAETYGQVRLQVAQELARESQEVLSSQPTRSVFLASQAMRTTIEEGGVPDRQLRQTLQDALSLAARRGFKGHLAAIQALTISPDGRWLVSGSNDGTARLWDFSAEDPAAAIVLRGHQRPLSAVAITPNCRWLVTAGRDATAMLWDLAKPDPSEEPLVLKGHRGPINAIAVTANSRWLVTVAGDLQTDDNTGRLWDLTRDDPSDSPIVLRGHDKPVVCVAISRDSHWIVTGSQDGTVRRFDLTAQFPAAAQTVFVGHEGTVSAVAVSPDSQWMVTAGHDGTARVWELASPEPMPRSTILRGHTGPVSSVAVSPRGDLIATGSFDHTARLWMVGAPDPEATSVVLRGHEDRIHALQFSPDGRCLVTGSSDYTARIWDLREEHPGRTPIILRGHADRVNSLVISPDSRWLATGSGSAQGPRDFGIRLWDLEVDGLLDAARKATAGRISDADCRQAFLNAARRVGSPQ
jgi:WD40 repeat protein